MGSCISDVLFMPPKYIAPEGEDEQENVLDTKHGSQIHYKEFIKNENYMWLLLSHGNAENLQSVAKWVEGSLMQNVNINIIIYEYTGYGPEGKNFSPSEKYVYDDVDAVYEHLSKDKNIPDNRIIAYGRSVGSGPSCYIAEKHNLAGLIINCGFMSVYRVIFKFRFTMPGDMFPNIDRVKKINCPICVFHSIKDEIIPFYHGKELYRCAKHKFDPLFIDGTNHNNIDRLSDDVFKHMEKFFKRIDLEYKMVSREDDSGDERGVIDNNNIRINVD